MHLKKILDKSSIFNLFNQMYGDSRSLTREKFVRNEISYKNLFQERFNNTKFDIRADLLIIPYTHINCCRFKRILIAYTNFILIHY